MIPDDHAAIAARMREIKNEKKGDEMVCLLCEGTGWLTEVLAGDHFRLRNIECDACGNPERRPCP